MTGQRFKPGFPFRPGDVISFGRGDNRYTGTVQGVVLSALRVDSEDVGGLCSVRVQDVLGFVKPVVTEKEADALKVLYERGTLTVAEAKEVGLPLTGKVLTNLRARGLVDEFRDGVVSRDASSWQVAPEYEDLLKGWYS